MAFFKLKLPCVENDVDLYAPLVLRNLLIHAGIFTFGLQFLFLDFASRKKNITVHESITGGSSLICKEGFSRSGFPWGGARGSLTAHSPLQSATLPSQHYHYLRWPNLHSACSPFCYVLPYLLFIKFISGFYHVCGTEQLLKYVIF